MKQLSQAAARKEAKDAAAKAKVKKEEESKTIHNGDPQ